ncbi:MAG: hypothetical protein HY760_08205 [Nitrospirae bacterium]|nr:hypothetical protein [Nitrospirota bacterium]
MKTLPIPKPLLWDYAVPPEDLLWRLQRIADFFPLYGTDRETVAALFEHRDDLRMDRETRLLVEEFHQAWKAKDG